MTRKSCQLSDHEDGDQVDSHGRCLGLCFECGEHLECTGRYTVYCPSCNVCPECNCPEVDGFAHYQGCKLSAEENENEEEEEDDE